MADRPAGREDQRSRVGLAVSTVSRVLANRGRAGVQVEGLAPTVAPHLEIRPGAGEPGRTDPDRQLAERTPSGSGPPMAALCARTSEAVSRVRGRHPSALPAVVGIAGALALPATCPF